MLVMLVKWLSQSYLFCGIVRGQNVLFADSSWNSIKVQMGKEMRVFFLEKGGERVYMGSCS